MTPDRVEQLALMLFSALMEEHDEWAGHQLLDLCLDYDLDLSEIIHRHYLALPTPRANTGVGCDPR